MMVNIRLLFVCVCSVGCSLWLTNAWRVKWGMKTDKKELFRELSQVSLSNPLHAITFQGLFASLRCEICWLTVKNDPIFAFNHNLVNWCLAKYMPTPSLLKLRPNEPGIF
jgi:hypothetical protein